MKFFYTLFSLAFPLSLLAQNYSIENGQVWNGTTFTQRDLYVSNGAFVDHKPPRLDSLIDASGSFIIPPFGDFHTHSFDGDYARRTDSLFLARGIFFSQDLGNNPVGRKKMSAYFNESTTIDVAFANACLTSNFGHPIEGYERMALGINWPRSMAERAQIKNSRLYENKTYFLLDRAAEIPAKMERLLSTQPDLIKLILWDSEEYATQDTLPLYNKGIDPAFIPEIVAIAKAYRTPVVAHIDTEMDLINALEGGVKRFAHAPFYGYANDGNVGEGYPRLSARAKTSLSAGDSIIVNPTLYRTFLNLTYLPKEYQLSEEDQQLLEDFHVHLLTDLAATGVTIAAGADFPGVNAIDEVYYYDKLKAFTPAELLNMLIRTSELIFPSRKIGKLTAGYEANCLITEDNPTEDIRHLDGILFRMKAGRILK